jgi:hypothetical protein
MKATTTNRWIGTVVLIVALVGLWQGVFYATGLAGGKPAPAKVTPPGMVALWAPKTDWVDMKVWGRTHPTWEPDE